MTTESTNETPPSLTTAASGTSLGTDAEAGSAATRAAVPPPAERGRGRQVLIRLNHAEHEALGMVARQHGQSVASYVRGLLYGSVGFSQAVNERTS